MPRIRIAACQVNPTVGDLDGNTQLVLDALDEAEAAGADVAVFPELVLTGYPPEDLLLKPGFIADNHEALQKVAARTGGCAAVIGFVDAGRDLFNAAAVCAHGSVLGVYQKRLLPNYTVFDEQRYFAPGRTPLHLFRIAGVLTGISICEDAWSPTGPIAEHAAGGAELVLNINASPFYAGRLRERETMLSTRANDASCALVYVNQVGGQDELVFDGASLVFDSGGRVVASAPQFVSHNLVVDLEVQPVFRKRLLDPRGRAVATDLPVIDVTAESTSRSTPILHPAPAEVKHGDAEVYDALVLGTRDYVGKNGFGDVVIGLSGGIDSTLVACIAADALGPDRVHGVSMPSRYSSEHSKDDARALAENLGLDYRTIAIESMHASFCEALGPDFKGLADENLQSRIRGVTLMGLSNQYGWLVLTTGNKSESAVGYSTLYGDTAGGFAVLRDVPKLLVYRLCHYRNSLGPDGGPIPGSVLTKPPSAELRPDQRDDESLPPYEILDPIIEGYVEDDLTTAQLVELGFDAETVKRVVRLVDIAEYKRRQTPIGVRVTPKAFGKDRRVPITNGYRG